MNPLLIKILDAIQLEAIDEMKIEPDCVDVCVCPSLYLDIL